jgi:NTE family protein
LLKFYTQVIFISMRHITLIFSINFLVTILSAQPPQYKNLVLEGAGVRGFAYTGAFQVLDSMQVLKNIERVGGTSAGAIQAMLLAVGYTPEEMIRLTANVPLRKFNDGGWFFVGGMQRMKKQFGWYKGDKILEWLHQLIAAKTGNGDISFAELHEQKSERGFKDLYITGTDLTYQCLRVFSYEHYPGMRIKDAVRISLSIPFYYKPVLVDDTGKVYKQPEPGAALHVMVDGGLLGNYPLFLFDSSKYVLAGEGANKYMENSETLGLLMEMPEQIEYSKRRQGNFPFVINSMNGYVKAIYHAVIDKANPEASDTSSWHRTISISHLNLSPRVRKLPRATVTALLESGREGARRFFQKAEGIW